MCVHAGQKHAAADKSLNHLDICSTLYYYANSTAASVDSLQVRFRNSCCPFFLTVYPLNPNYLVFFSKDELFKFTSNPQINKSNMPCCFVSLRLYKKINTKNTEVNAKTLPVLEECVCTCGYMYMYMIIYRLKCVCVGYTIITAVSSSTENNLLCSILWTKQNSLS